MISGTCYEIAYVNGADIFIVADICDVNTDCDNGKEA